MQSQDATFQELYAPTGGTARAGSRKPSGTIETAVTPWEASIVNGGSQKNCRKQETGRQDTLKKSSHISRRKCQKRHQLVIPGATKKLAEQKVEPTWWRAGGNSQHHVVLPPVLLGKMRIATSLRSPDLLIHPCTWSRRAEEKRVPKRSGEEFSRKGPEACDLDERFPTNSGALWNTRCVSDEGIRKRKRPLAACDTLRNS